MAAFFVFLSRLLFRRQTVNRGQRGTLKDARTALRRKEHHLARAAVAGRMETRDNFVSHYRLGE